MAAAGEAADRSDVPRGLAGPTWRKVALGVGVDIGGGTLEAVGAALRGEPKTAPGDKNGAAAAALFSAIAGGLGRAGPIA